MKLRASALLWGAVIALALSARFVFETALVNRLPAAIAVAAAVVPAALVLAALSFRLPARAPFSRGDRMRAAVAGVLGVWASPFLVAAVRRTDAPSGTEVLFLTSAVWGLMLVVGGLALRRDRSGLLRLIAALFGVTAAAGILANWERPSSFSPFIKFPGEETVILLAGVAFAATAFLLEDLVRKHGPLRALRAVVLPGAVVAAVAALVLAPTRLSGLAQPGVWAFAGPASVAVFALLLGWAEVLASRPAYEVAGAYLLTPVLLSALSLLEYATGVFGPDPIRWKAAGPSMALAAMAAVAVVAFSAGERPAGGRARPLLLAARAVAGLSFVMAAIALVSPDIDVSVKGVLSTGAAFQTRFAMLGFETVGGWLAACCSLLVLAWAWRPVPRTGRWLCVALLALAVAVWVPVHATPTHTWTRWIPPEVQQDYGTEFASRIEQPVTDPWELAALGGAVAAAALLFVEARQRAEEAPEGQEVLTG